MFDNEKKYLTISEISKITQVPSYTLRYWEKEIKQLKPERRAGLRKYCINDVELINTIKELLYKKRYTIEGVKKFLNGDKRKKAPTQNGYINNKIISEIKVELEEIKKILSQ